MKRLLLLAIILFPLLTLIAWVYWGVTHHKNSLPAPPVTNAAPAMNQ